MVNYLYDHDSIEDNHEIFVLTGPSWVRPMSTHCSKLEPMLATCTRATERR